LFFRNRITGIECVSEETLKIITDLKGGLQITDFHTLSGAWEGISGHILDEIKTKDDVIYVRRYRKFKTLPEITGEPMAAYCCKNKTTYLFLPYQQVIALFREGRYLEEKAPYSRITSMYQFERFIYQDSKNTLEKFGETY
jgi:hypothetical protein